MRDSERSQDRDRGQHPRQPADEFPTLRQSDLDKFHLHNQSAAPHSHLHYSCRVETPRSILQLHRTSTIRTVDAPQRSHEYCDCITPSPSSVSLHHTTTKSIAVAPHVHIQHRCCTTPTITSIPARPQHHHQCRYCASSPLFASPLQCSTASS